MSKIRASDLGAGERCIKHSKYVKDKGHKLGGWGGLYQIVKIYVKDKGLRLGVGESCIK